MARRRIPSYSGDGGEDGRTSGEARRVIDAREADARGLRLRGVHRDISGNIIGGRDQLSGDKVVLPPSGHDSLVPPMGEGMEWLKRQQARRLERDRSAISYGAAAGDLGATMAGTAAAMSPGVGPAAALTVGNSPMGGISDRTTKNTGNPLWDGPAPAPVLSAGGMAADIAQVKGAGAGAAPAPRVPGNSGRPRVPVYAAFGAGTVLPGSGASTAGQANVPQAELVNPLPGAGAGTVTRRVPSLIGGQAPAGNGATRLGGSGAESGATLQSARDGASTAAGAAGAMSPASSDFFNLRKRRPGDFLKAGGMAGS